MQLTSRLPRFVVDASVAVKWHLRDEDDVAAADALLAAYREGHVRLLAPDQIRYEVASAIRNAYRTRRLTAEQGLTAISDFSAWQLPTVNDNALLLAAYDRALHFGCSFYDGLYAALAERAACPLIYADRRLRNAFGARFPYGLWLADYVHSV